MRDDESSVDEDGIGEVESRGEAGLLHKIHKAHLRRHLLIRAGEREEVKVYHITSTEWASQICLKTTQRLLPTLS